MNTPIGDLLIKYPTATILSGKISGITSINENNVNEIIELNTIIGYYSMSASSKVSLVYLVQALGASELIILLDKILEKRELEALPLSLKELTKYNAVIKEIRKIISSIAASSRNLVDMISLTNAETVLLSTTTRITESIQALTGKEEDFVNLTLSLNDEYTKFRPALFSDVTASNRLNLTYKVQAAEVIKKIRGLDIAYNMTISNSNPARIAGYKKDVVDCRAAFTALGTTARTYVQANRYNITVISAHEAKAKTL